MDLLVEEDQIADYSWSPQIWLSRKGGAANITETTNNNKKMGVQH
jgi:hypothetical protein